MNIHGSSNNSVTWALPMLLIISLLHVFMVELHKCSVISYSQDTTNTSSYHFCSQAAILWRRMCSTKGVSYQSSPVTVVPQGELPKPTSHMSSKATKAMPDVSLPAKTMSDVCEFEQWTGRRWLMSLENTRQQQ